MADSAFEATAFRFRRGRLAYRLRRSHYRSSRANASARTEQAVLASLIDELTRERDGLKDTLLRTRAELENQRKRLEREREEIVRRAGENIISDLLPVLDNFGRAIEAAGTASDLEAVRRGVGMILDQMRAALFNRGLQPVEAVGQVFDPALHEAVAIEERDDVEANRVVGVVREGFRLNGRLLRAAMVRVSKRARKEASSGE